MDVIFYTTGCPRCRVLKSKLDSKEIEYSVINDTDEMIRLGISSVPHLSVNGEIMNFKESVDWINSL